MRQLKRWLAVVGAACALPMLAQADEAWPQRPVTVVAPFAPGGVTDIVARAVSQHLASSLGQPFVVSNRPGAQGVIGTNAVARTEADGYTLVLMSSSVACVNPYLRKDVPFDVARDFDSIGIIGNVPLVMLVHPDAGMRTVDEFIDFARKKPGGASYSSPGVGGSAHMYGELLNTGESLNMVHVPYQGGAMAWQAVMAKEVEMTMADMSVVASQVLPGNLTALAVSGTERWPTLPDVPTFVEAGQNVELVGWVGLMAPKGTPEPVLRKLHEALRVYTSAPAAGEDFVRYGMLPNQGSRQDMTDTLVNICPLWGEAVRNAGIEPE